MSLVKASCVSLFGIDSRTTGTAAISILNHMFTGDIRHYMNAVHVSVILVGLASVLFT